LLLDDSTTTHAWTDHSPKRKLDGLDNKEYPLHPHFFSLLEGRYLYSQRFRHAKHRQERISADSCLPWRNTGASGTIEQVGDGSVVVYHAEPTRLSRSASVRILPETLLVGPDGAGATVDVVFADERVDRSGVNLQPMVPTWIGSILRGAAEHAVQGRWLLTIRIRSVSSFPSHRLSLRLKSRRYPLLHLISLPKPTSSLDVAQDAGNAIPDFIGRSF
jgi:hypothetical protein